MIKINVFIYVKITTKRNEKYSTKETVKGIFSHLVHNVALKM